MCGFVALFQEKLVFDPATIRVAADRLAHRGPDAGGEWCDNHAILLHRRLSIIDLATGQQPMQSGDGRYVVVFNGEIYNFQELRAQLEKDGSSFRTESDTEVVLEGYRRWGAGVVGRLNGIFAFVVWDRWERRVFGARDRLGIKPLCWALKQGALIVSSTLEPFDALNGFRQIDPVAIRDLMAFEYIPSPRTIYQDAQKLEPGCTIDWCLGGSTPRIDRYWSPPPVDFGVDAPEEWELEELLSRAVRRQMISDVPIGVFLSGGVDSSLVAAFMARHSEKPIRSFSISFRDKAADESPVAALVARQLGADHTVFPADDIGPDALLELIGRLDEPFADPALVPTYALSRMTASHVKVALSGDGGDEVFGGYPKYFLGRRPTVRLPLQTVLDKSLRMFPWSGRGLSRVYWQSLPLRERVHWSWVTYGDFPIFRKDIRELLHPRFHELAYVSHFPDPWEQRARRYGDDIDMDLLMRTDLETYLSEDCLVKTDRASMLASLEVRVPLLDEMVLDRILPLHADTKIAGGTLKALLMPIVRRLLPREVWDRPKHGFHVPLDQFMAGLWRPAIEAALEWGEANISYFCYPYLRRLHALNLSKGGIARELWNPFVFLAWAMARNYRA